MALPSAGNDRPHLELQNKAWNCGSTAFHAAIRTIGLHPDLDPDSIEILMGTNDVVGTIPRYISRAAFLLGVEGFRINPAGSLPADMKPRFVAWKMEFLESALHRHLVLLRTSMGGSKHWILALSRRPDGDFEIFDPARGYVDMNAEEVFSAWAARKFDGFAIDRRPEEHRQALKEPMTAAQAIALAPKSKPVFEMTFQEFLELPQGSSDFRPRIVDEADFGAAEIAAIAAARQAVEEFPRNPSFRRMKIDHPALEFRAESGRDSINDMLVVDRATKRVAGVCAHGTTYVVPEFRGRGVGRDMVLAAHSHPGLRFLAPSHFSKAGFAARLSAYRKAYADAGKTPDLPEWALTFGAREIRNPPSSENHIESEKDAFCRPSLRPI
ncbi:MAG: hypothetical protein ING19_14015 [Azospirillum sp.]|nr:hypothetical protein [Azospirillum sp.]